MALNANACYGQPKYVEAPEGNPLKYGIFSVADFRPADGPFWQQGVEWQRDQCGPASLYGCPTCDQNNFNQEPDKTYVEGVPLEDGFPFTVYASFKCSPIGHWADAEDRAKRNLANGEERAVEAMVAEGTHADQRALTNASSVDATPTPGTPVTVAQGLAILEAYIAANGKGEGVILGNRRDILLANAEGKLIERVGDDHLETLLGTPVAALGGFPARVGPNGTAAGTGEAWLFAIGSRPYIWRGETFLTSDKDASLDTGYNNLEILAERTYLVGWDCFTVGVLITSIGDE